MIVNVEQNEDTVRLLGSGRDVEPYERYIVPDPMTVRWRVFDESSSARQVISELKLARPLLNPLEWESMKLPTLN